MCRSSFDASYEALFALETATAAAYRDEGAGSGVEKQLAVFQAAKVTEERFTDLALALGVALPTITTDNWPACEFARHSSTPHGPRLPPKRPDQAAGAGQPAAAPRRSPAQPPMAMPGHARRSRRAQSCESHARRARPPARGSGGEHGQGGLAECRTRSWYQLSVAPRCNCPPVSVCSRGFSSAFK